MSNENNLISVKSTEDYKKEFENGTKIVAEQTDRLIETLHPSYMIPESKIGELIYENSAELLDAVTFFKIKSYFTESEEELQHYLNEKMTKFYTAMHAVNKPIIYGVISYAGSTNLVVGIYTENLNTNTIESIMRGLLDGVELEPYCPSYTKREVDNLSSGFISGIPSLKLGEERQTFDISSVMRSLNGQNYSLLFVSRPVNNELLSDVYTKIIQVKDACYSVSKRNISRQYGENHSIGESTGNTMTHSKSSSSTKTKGGSIGIGFIVNLNRNGSTSDAESESTSSSISFNQTITDTINHSAGESQDIQNGFALEMIEYADKAINRLRQGKGNGMWETMISYSANSEIAKQILEASISGEISKPNPDILPAFIQNTDRWVSPKNPIILPKLLKNESTLSPLCTMLTSEELGFMGTPPSRSVPDFMVRVEKNYPLVSIDTGGVHVGNLNDGTRVLENMSFSLSDADLARHTFVCGITGSGKTTTVKRILDQANVPFLVIESSKAEYRNTKLSNGKKVSVYTLGRPEINCLSFNPFYIQNGVNPQTHIDLLKDLFNASFAFYGPMPYILEKCLHNIYKDKGWNLILGYHPFLANTDNIEDLFDSDFVDEKYKSYAHKYLYPTMQDLKDEVERYIEQELNYEGEVAGNIKTAIKARIESLCTGAKGYMFNTDNFLNMDELLHENIVFELEGLADDADKAFAVGMMVIFINEYRQLRGRRKSKESPLAHLLVIEEAHRLLKNTSTEHLSEDVGNPKGKAVEHFTNMIAEMRSYGQGVIVAEQIPTKLAPDVIKNSSNKIVQRLVAIDDQTVIANTIGINSENALQLGTLSTGEALCHKEGMNKPVRVNIIPTTDVKVTDEMLYSENIIDRTRRINLSLMNEAIGSSTSELTIQLLNSILIQDVRHIADSISTYRQVLRKICLQKNIMIIGENDRDIQSIVIASAIERCLLSGTYKVKKLFSNHFETELLTAIQNPSEEHIDELRSHLREAYGDNPKYKGKYIIAMLLISQYEKNMDLEKTIQNYFICPDEASVYEIKDMVKESAIGNNKFTKNI